ncbi:putative ribonuclease H-like domain-containing protein [Tanacetum coccineum]
MDNRRPRTSSFSPSSRSSTTRTPNRPHRPKKIVKSIWVKKGRQSRRGRITGKGTIKTSCIDFENVSYIIDENLVLLRAPRKNDVYSLNLKSINPSGGVTCLVAKASEDEAILWHRRLGHVNFKKINKLVKSRQVCEGYS